MCHSTLCPFLSWTYLRTTLHCRLPHCTNTEGLFESTTKTLRKEANRFALVIIVCKIFYQFLLGLRFENITSGKSSTRYTFFSFLLVDSILLEALVLSQNSNILTDFHRTLVGSLQIYSLSTFRVQHGISWCSAV